jgi:DNA-binding LacI/PurR family transcriptional regulator
MEDVACAAGVSRMTVSLALRQHPSIPATTRNRVLAIAEKLRYKPDPMLSALVAYRLSRRLPAYAGTVAWVTNGPTRRGWNFWRGFGEFFQGASERAQQLGYKLEEFWLREPGLSPERAKRILLTRNIRGLLIAPQPNSHGRLRLDWKEFSTVSFGYSLVQPQLHMVSNRQFGSVVTAVRRLRALGYRRIGLAIPAQEDERVDHHWQGGFHVGQQLFKLADRIPVLLMTDLTDAEFRRWFKKHRPDAVVTGHQPVFDWLPKMGARVPEDVGVAWLAADRNQMISGIDQNCYLTGVTAMDFLVSMLHRNERGIPANPLRILVEGSWHKGRTVRRVNLPSRPPDVAGDEG